MSKIKLKKHFKNAPCEFDVENNMNNRFCVQSSKWEESNFVILFKLDSDQMFLVFVPWFSRASLIAWVKANKNYFLNAKGVSNFAEIILCKSQLIIFVNNRWTTTRFEINCSISKVCAWSSPLTMLG